jgi:hypothetical protein
MFSWFKDAADMARSRSPAKVTVPQNPGCGLGGAAFLNHSTWFLILVHGRDRGAMEKPFLYEGVHGK